MGNAEIKCALVDADSTLVSLLEDYADQMQMLRWVGSYNSAIQALLSYSSAAVDVLFVRVGGLDLSVAELARQLAPRTCIVLMSDDAVDVLLSVANVVATLSLSPTYEEFEQAISTARLFLSHVDDPHYSYMAKSEPHTTSRDDGKVYVRSGRKMVRVDLNRILYIEAQKDYVRFVFDSGEPLLVHISMNRTEKMLPSAGFMRIHRSFIIQKSKVTGVRGSNVELGSIVLPIGPLYQRDFNRYFKHNKNFHTAL